MKEIRDFFKMFGARSAIEILEFLGDHGEAHHKEMLEFVQLTTLNKRLRNLLRYGLVQHHLERSERKTEWYEITEKGRKVLYHVKELVQLMEK